MHRTQIYFDETLFEAVQQKAARCNLSVSAYIREVLQKELETEKDLLEPIDLTGFSGLWEDYDVSQESLREKAWK